MKSTYIQLVNELMDICRPSEPSPEPQLETLLPAKTDSGLPSMESRLPTTEFSSPDNSLNQFSLGLPSIVTGADLIPSPTDTAASAKQEATDASASSSDEQQIPTNATKDEQDTHHVGVSDLLEEDLHVDKSEEENSESEGSVELPFSSLPRFNKLDAQTKAKILELLRDRAVEVKCALDRPSGEYSVKLTWLTSRKGNATEHKIVSITFRSQRPFAPRRVIAVEAAEKKRSMQKSSAVVQRPLRAANQPRDLQWINRQIDMIFDARYAQLYKEAHLPTGGPIMSGVVDPTVDYHYTPFPAFLLSYSDSHFGLPTLTSDHLTNLIKCAEKYSPVSPKARLFRKMIDLEDDDFKQQQVASSVTQARLGRVGYVGFILFLRAVLIQASTVVKVPLNIVTEYVYSKGKPPVVDGKLDMEGLGLMFKNNRIVVLHRPVRKLPIRVVDGLVALPLILNILRIALPPRARKYALGACLCTPGVWMGSNLAFDPTVPSSVLLTQFRKTQKFAELDRVLEVLLDGLVVMHEFLDDQTTETVEYEPEQSEEYEEDEYTYEGYDEFEDVQPQEIYM